jgi:hypothetical protein
MQGVGLRKDGLLVHESLGDGQLSEGAPALIRPAARAIDLRDGGEERSGMTLANTAALRQSLVMRGYEELWRVRLLGTACVPRGDVVGIALTSSDLISPAQKSAFELPRRAAARQRVAFKKRE